MSIPPHQRWLSPASWRYCYEKIEGDYHTHVPVIPRRSGCSSSKETPDISEDQMNHYAGIAEHNHPTNSTNATPQSPTPNPAKKQ
ncbi:MAG: hypothetical protein ACJAWY_002845 [Sphingomonas echinoides]|jgi:hypothetical protein